MPAHDKLWVLDDIENIVVITCHVIVVFDDMKPLFASETNRDTFNRQNDIHGEPLLPLPPESDTPDYKQSTRKIKSPAESARIDLESHLDHVT